MKLTKRGINRFLNKHRREVIIRCEEEFEDFLAICGSFIYEGELYSATAVFSKQALESMKINPELLFMNLIDQYEKKRAEIVDKPLTLV